MRLRDIDPAALGEDVHNQLYARLMALSQHLGGDPAPPLTRPSNVRLTVHQLAHYARTGEPPEGRAELVGEYVQTLVDLDLVPDADALAGKRDLGDPLDVVVIGALARRRLDERRSVPEGWLAVLAGVAASRVRQLAAAGELRRTEGGIHAADARRWLESRSSARVDSRPSGPDSR